MQFSPNCPLIFCAKKCIAWVMSRKLEKWDFEFRWSVIPRPFVPVKVYILLRESYLIHLVSFQSVSNPGTIKGLDFMLFLASPDSLNTTGVVPDYYYNTHTKGKKSVNCSLFLWTHLQRELRFGVWDGVLSLEQKLFQITTGFYDFLNCFVKDSVPVWLLVCLYQYDKI